MGPTIDKWLSLLQNLTGFEEGNVPTLNMSQDYINCYTIRAELELSELYLSQRNALWTIGSCDCDDGVSHFQRPCVHYLFNTGWQSYIVDLRLLSESFPQIVLHGVVVWADYEIRASSDEIDEKWSNQIIH